MAAALVLLVVAIVPCRAAQSVAVLPFENLTGSPENDWIGSGFAATLTDKLRAVADLRVSDRQAVRTALDARGVDAGRLRAGDRNEAAKLQGVDAVLLGSVQMAGAVDALDAPLLINARVVQVATGRISDAILVRGRMRQLLELQNTLAFAFLDRLGLHPGPSEREALERHGTPSVEAYRFYAIGIAYAEAERYPEAIRAFEQALSKHPGILYADAHHELIQTYLRAGMKDQALARARKTVSDRAPLFYDLGLAAERAGRWPEAIQAYRTFLTYCDRRILRWRYMPSPAPGATFAADAGGVFLAGPDGCSLLLDAGSGALRWVRGSADTPLALLSGGAVYVADQKGARLQAYDAGTLHLRWQREMAAEPLTALSASGQMVFGVCGGRRVVALSAADGSPAWQADLPGRLAAGPAAHPQALFAGTEEGHVMGLALADGKILWQAELGGRPVDCTVSETTLFCAAANKVVALRVLDGKERWSVALAGEPAVGIAAAGGVVGVATRGGCVQAFDAAGGAPLWSKEGLAPGTPAVLGATVYAGTPHGEIVALAAPNGEERWRYLTPERAPVMPRVAGETLFAFGPTGSVYALNALDRTGPRDLDGYIRLASALHATGRSAEAIPLWRYVLDGLHPGSREARAGLAQSYRSLGRTAEAERQEALLKKDAARPAR